MPTTGDGEQAVVDFAPGFVPKPDRTYRSHMFVGVDYDLDTEHYEQSGFPDNALQTVLDARQALLESAVTLEVVDKGVNANNQDVQSVVVQNNLLGHNFPTGFAFARQFWLEVTAKTADGQEVCLVKPSSGIDTPCSSGVVESRAGRAAPVRSGRASSKRWRPTPHSTASPSTRRRSATSTSSSPRRSPRTTATRG